MLQKLIKFAYILMSLGDVLYKVYYIVTKL
jgi:hypothetical protein